MQKICIQCRQHFEITNDDLAFYEKVSPVFSGKCYNIPPPTLCPDCRVQRRWAFRNEWKLYHRKCDKTGKQIISVYSPDKPYVVYDQAVWWSDAYDPLEHGREFDFSQSFFDQFHDLNHVVPKLAIHNAKSENCAYTNYSAENKNCYLLVGGLGAEDCLYSYRVFYSSDVVDCYDLIKCQRCYECLESSECYNCCYCRNCHNSSDLFLCEDCTGCRQCFGCANLRNKEYHIYNIPFSKEEYEKRMQNLRRNPSGEVLRDIRALHLSVPHRYAHIIQSDSSTGDQLLECQRCTDCYTLKHSQDCRHCIIGENDRDCQDANFFDNCELQYESSNLEKNYHTAFSLMVWYCKEIFYSMNCFNSDHLFGCSGMKKHRYCILNKQYTKEEYERLVPKIIEHMKKHDEYGEFFPIKISPFGYNETVAHEHFPLTKEEAVRNTWIWHDEAESRDKYLGPQPELSSKIEEVPDDITKQILLCEITGKPYKIIPQELEFYRDMHLPIPRRCFEQRHSDRMTKRNPRRLWDRECAKCKKSIQTTYAPDRPEIVHCEFCYLATIY